jgi:mRNA interferase RelE/StbE
MEITINRQFSKDLREVHPIYQRRVADLIAEIRLANDIRSIRNIEPCEGASNAYRIRIGDFRIGVRIGNDNIVKFERIKKRGDFYNFFP